MESRLTELLKGIRDELPILVGVIPFGMVYGVAALAAGIPAGMAQAMSFIIFAGSAQFAAVQLIAAGAPGLVIIATAFMLNLRHMLYSASLAPYLKNLRSGWKWLLAYLLTDEAYAVTIVHYQRERDTSSAHWYFLGAGVALWGTWQVSTALGILLGAQLPTSWSLDFTSTLTFIALVVPALKGRTHLMTALTAGTAALLFMNLPLKFGLLLATCVGIGVGLWSEPWSRSWLKKSSSPVQQKQEEVMK